MAGKVTGLGGGLPGGVPPGSRAPDGAPPEARKVARNDESRPVAESRPPFAEQLKAAHASRRATADQAAAPAENVTADLPAALQVGKIGHHSAVSRVMDRVLDNQLGANAPAAVREKLRTALEDAVADDPLLASKIGRLG